MKISKLIMQHDTSVLSMTLGYFHPISKGIEQYLQQNITLHFVKKKKLLLKAGALCNHVYFIRKGAVRGFIKDGEKDITTWITVEGEMVTSISGLDVRTPSFDNIQTIEDCELFALSYNSLDELYKQFPEFNIVSRKLLQRYYHDAERRAFLCRLTNAESKYDHFLKTQAHLANRIALKYIASYLGISEETLSRIRKKNASTLKPAE